MTTVNAPPAYMPVQCPACEATGVYVGLKERYSTIERLGALCMDCDGSGAIEVPPAKFEEYKPFKKRRMRLRIRKVWMNPGSENIDPKDIVTYGQFRQQVEPAKRNSRRRLPWHTHARNGPVTQERGEP